MLRRAWPVTRMPKRKDDEVAHVRETWSGSSANSRHGRMLLLSGGTHPGGITALRPLLLVAFVPLWAVYTVETCALQPSHVAPVLLAKL